MTTKTVMLVETNANTCFVTLDHEDKIALCYSGEEAVGATSETLATIEDDSSWEEIDYDAFVSQEETPDFQIVAEIEMEL